uniref:Uncharacterized protein n=1 Tax=Panagrolaimus sp. ES5 TaxID=591445 RepID=A0AC34FNG6_9BILA
MLARRICNTSFMACRTISIVQRQSQIRLINVSALARKDVNNQMDQDKKVNSLNNDLNKGKPSSSSGGGNSMMLIAAGVVVAAGAAYWMFGGKGVEKVKDKAAGHLLAHKANKEYENAKETIIKVATTLGGKELADKVAKTMDEAKDMVEKMASETNAKENIGKAYRQGQNVIANISENGITHYIGEFDNVKDFILKEAKKMGIDEKKVTKVMDEAKDKVQKLVKNIGKDGINADEIKNIQEYAVKEFTKLGGSGDLGKTASKYFEEAQDKLQKMAGSFGENGLSDKQFEKVKDFVVKEAEKIGGRDLAKKAAKMMDEAKETIEKIAKEYSKHGAASAANMAKDEVQKKIH